MNKVSLSILLMSMLTYRATSNYFSVDEKSTPGTVVISNLSQVLAQMKNLYFSNAVKSSIIMKISNFQDAGVIWFKIDAETDALLINEPPNRDSLCAGNKLESINFIQTELNKITLVYPKSDEESVLCLVRLSIFFGPASNPVLVPLTISINDINDNSPTFPKQELTIRMKEHSMLDLDTSSESEFFSIPLITASDNDASRNDIRSYMLEGEDSALFKLHAEISDNNQIKLSICGLHQIISTSQTCTRNPKLFDRESRDEFKLTLTAIDDGLPSRAGHVKIRIIIEDINDFRPKFLEPSYLGKFNENDPQGTLVLKVSVQDDDVDFQNSKVNFRLPGSFSKQSKVSLSKAQLAAANFFDIETDIKAGHSNQNNVTFARLIVKAGQTEVRSKAMQSLMEAAKDTHRDNSFGQSNMYPHQLSALALSSAASQASYVKRIEFVIEAFDHGEPMLSSQVKVSLLITDVNNMKPNIFITYMSPIVLNKNSIHQMNYGRIPENQDRSMLAHVVVTDQDSFVAENDITCSLSDARFILEEIFDNSNLQSMSEMNGPERNTKNYRLMSVTKLDRERPDLMSKGDTFKFLITCTDNIKGILPGGRLTTIQEVRVLIGDENDNYPIFERDHYQFTVPENQPNFENINEHSKYRIGTLRALDADDGVNAVTRYQLLTNPYEAFEVDERNGTLYVVRPFDREQIESVSLKVIAVDDEHETFMQNSYDQGLSRERQPFQMTSTTLVEVFIEDVNDCPPRFRETTYYFEVEENSSNFDIGYLEAIDDDRSNQTKINYHLGYPFSSQKGSHMGPDMILNEDLIQIFSHFQLDRNTGQLRLKQKLDRENKANYEFMVYATDDNSSFKSGKDKIGTASVIITVLDVNDNVPVINSPKHQEELFWGNSITAGNTIFTMMASDADLGENATLRYVLLREERGNPETAEMVNVSTSRPYLSPLPIACDENSGNFYFTKTLLLETSMPYTYSLNILVEDLGSVVKLNTSIIVYVTIGAKDSELYHSPHQNYNEVDVTRSLKINTKMILLILSFVFILLMVMLMVLICYKRIFIRTSTSAIGPDGFKIPGYHTSTLLKPTNVALNNMIKNQYLDDYPGNGQYIPTNLSPKISTLYRINNNGSDNENINNSTGRQRKAYYFPIAACMSQQGHPNQTTTPPQHHHRFMQTNLEQTLMDEKNLTDDPDQFIDHRHNYMSMIQPNHCYQPYADMKHGQNGIRCDKYEKLTINANHHHHHPQHQNVKLLTLQNSPYKIDQKKHDLIEHDHKDQVFFLNNNNNNNNNSTNSSIANNKNLAIFTIKNNNTIEQSLTNELIGNNNISDNTTTATMSTQSESRTSPQTNSKQNVESSFV